MSNFNNDKWIIDYEADIEKGTVIDLKTDKKYYFTPNYGLPSSVPSYIREKAKEFIKNANTEVVKNEN